MRDELKARRVPADRQICFFYSECESLAVYEKGGRFVCQSCAPRVAGKPLSIRAANELSHGCGASTLRYDLWMAEARKGVR